MIENQFGASLVDGNLKGSTHTLNHVESRQELGMTILSPRGRKPGRRVLYVNSYGGSKFWEQVRQREEPTHHLWGCVELAAMGYEIAIAEPLAYFSWRQRLIRQDFPLVSVVRDWLGKDGIVFAGHTVLYWIPFLKRLRALKTNVVSLCFARETLDFATAHSGIIAMTPAAEKEARRAPPHVKVAHLGWGVDLDFYPDQGEGSGERFFACGKTLRDFQTLAAASRLTTRPFDVICYGLPAGLTWGQGVTIHDRRQDGDLGVGKAVSYKHLLNRFYPETLASLVIINPDPLATGACGFTNLLEAMAMRRAVICTRTGAIPEELDIEAKNCGLFVDPADPQSLAEAVERLSRNPEMAQTMGQQGRKLCDQHYNIERFAKDLAGFFESF